MSDRHSKKRATMMATLQDKTGRSLEQWLAVLDHAPAEGFMNQTSWLKEEHGLGHFQARMIVTEKKNRS